MPNRRRFSVRELAAMSESELGQLDIALVNLSCAVGLPGAESLDIEDCLATLDRWARQVQEATDRYLPQFRSKPAEFDHSLAKFQILCMVTVLQRDLGVHYNPDFMDGPYNATDSRTHFIHGPLTGFGGTCVNLPVLYIAVGRRLGYPLKLVLAREHYFVRWSGPGDERFNIEATSLGFIPYDDEHYRTWPKPLSSVDCASGRYLRDLTARQELACFIGERGYVCQDNLLMPDALVAFKAAATCDRRYEVDWAIATMIARIHSNLVGPIPDNDFVMEADIMRASPKAKEPWERLVMPHAHAHLLRIYKLLVAKSRTERSTVKPIPRTE